MFPAQSVKTFCGLSERKIVPVSFRTVKKRLYFRRNRAKDGRIFRNNPGKRRMLQLQERTVSRRRKTALVSRRFALQETFRLLVMRLKTYERAAACAAACVYGFITVFRKGNCVSALLHVVPGKNGFFAGMYRARKYVFYKARSFEMPYAGN